MPGFSWHRQLLIGRKPCAAHVLRAVPSDPAAGAGERGSGAAGQHRPHVCPVWPHPQRASRSVSLCGPGTDNGQGLSCHRVPVPAQPKQPCCQPQVTAPDISCALPKSLCISASVRHSRHSSGGGCQSLTQPCLQDGWNAMFGAEGVTCACRTISASGQGLQGHTSHSKSLERILSKTRLSAGEPGRPPPILPASVDVQA